MRWALLSMIVALAGCGSSEKQDAQKLVAHVRAVDPELSAAERRPRLDELETLPIATATLRELRDTCVEAHRSLLVAEEQAELATTTIRTAGSASQLTAEQRTAVERALATQERSVAKAEELLPQCEREVDALALRYAQN